MPHQHHSNVREGLRRRTDWGLIVAAWYFAVDLGRGEMLYTPNVLGQVFAQGDTIPSTRTITSRAVVQYSLLHFGWFFLFGIAPRGTDPPRHPKPGFPHGRLAVPGDRVRFLARNLVHALLAHGSAVPLVDLPDREPAGRRLDGILSLAATPGSARKHRGISLWGPRSSRRPIRPGAPGISRPGDALRSGAVSPNVMARQN